MATKEREVLSSAGGLASTVAVESHGELGEAVEAIRARGYWENVWRRFRRDRVAIASGIFIVFLILTAFAGAPIAAHFLGHGPNYQFGLNATDTCGVVLGLFTWFYPARIIRAQVLSLREKEFIEAARMVGASDARIVRSHLVPHLIAPMIVYSTLIVAQFVLAEAGLSYLGLGIKLPTASWGNLLQTATDFYIEQPWLMVWPGLAVLLTTLAFNLLGDGLRDAFDPRST